jgi:IS5 family transposase
MKAKAKDRSQMGFYSTFEEQLNHQHSLYILANEIQWRRFEDAFSKCYSADMGASAKPIRLMVSLLILKQLRNLSGITHAWLQITISF